MRYAPETEPRYHAVLLPRWGGRPGELWQPYVGTALAKLGFTTTVAEMPNPDEPARDAWVSAAADCLRGSGPNPFVITHSLGFATLANVLREQEHRGKPVVLGGVVAVAANINHAGFEEQIGEFFDPPLDLDIVARASTGGTELIYGRLDPWSTVEQGQELQAALGEDRCRMTIVEDAGHFSYGEEAGLRPCMELPQVIESVSRLLGEQ